MATVTYTSNTIIRDEVWGYWVYDYTDCGTSSTTADCIWGEWVNDTSSTDTFIDHQGTVWREWATSESYEVDNGVVYLKTPEHPKFNVEQDRARKAQREINRVWSEIKFKERQEEQMIAEDTAIALLGELVSPEELAYYKEHGEILVKGKKCDYLIRKGKSGKSVIRVEKEKVVSMCIHLANQYKYPLSDNTVALKLMLEDNEKHFNKTANHTTVYGEDTKKSYREKVIELEKVKAA
jgi:hypothetical protein